MSFFGGFCLFGLSVFSDGVGGQGSAQTSNKLITKVVRKNLGTGWGERAVHKQVTNLKQKSFAKI